LPTAPLGVTEPVVTSRPSRSARAIAEDPLPRLTTSTSTGLESLEGEDPALLDDYLSARGRLSEWKEDGRERIERLALEVEIAHAGGEGGRSRSRSLVPDRTASRQADRGCRGPFFAQ